MKFISFSAATLYSSAYLLASAIPDVTVLKTSGEVCDWFPNSVRGNTAGPFQFHINQPDDRAIDGLLATTRAYSDAFGNMTTTIVMNLRKSYMFAHPMYRCTKGVLYDWGSPPDTAKNPSFSISKGPADLGQMTYSANGLPIETYRHMFDGKEQAGVFVGAENRTTWAFRYWQPNECLQKDFYFARLLQKGEKAQSGEIAGFLEVTGPHKPW